MSINQAIENLGNSLNNLRNSLIEANPDKVEEIDKALTDMLNHPSNPLKQIQMQTWLEGGMQKTSRQLRENPNLDQH